MRRPVLLSIAVLSVLLAGGLASLESRASGPPSFLAAATSSTPEPFSGTVDEVLDVPGYTYAHIIEPSGEGRWAVTLGKELEAGTQVDVRPFGELQDFHSKHADRTFDQMIFATLTPRSL